jgi:hypothetical protein
MNQATVQAVQGGFKPMQGVDIALKMISDCPKVDSSGIGWYRVRSGGMLSLSLSGTAAGVGRAHSLHGFQALGLSTLDVEIGQREVVVRRSQVGSLPSVGGQSREGEISARGRHQSDCGVDCFYSASAVAFLAQRRA